MNAWNTKTTILLVTPSLNADRNRLKIQHKNLLNQDYWLGEYQFTEHTFTRSILKLSHQILLEKNTENGVGETYELPSTEFIQKEIQVSTEQENNHNFCLFYYFTN